MLKHQAAETEAWVKAKFPQAKSIAVSVEDSWIQILINEEEVHMMEVVNCIQDNRQITDMNLQEISTESVIRKIYEGGVA